MSAEDQTRIFRMINNEYWVCICAAGQSETDFCYVVSKHRNFQSALYSAENINTEYGFQYITEDELLSQSAHLIKGEIRVAYMRKNNICYHTDLKQKQWQVVLIDDETNQEKIIIKNLWYAQAVNIAQIIGQTEPGDIRVNLNNNFYKSPNNLDLPNSPW